MLRLSSNLVCNIIGHSIRHFWKKKLIFYFNLAAILDLPYSAISQSVLGRFASNSKSKLISRFFCFINTLPPPPSQRKNVLILNTLKNKEIRSSQLNLEFSNLFFVSKSYKIKEILKMLLFFLKFGVV